MKEVILSADSNRYLYCVPNQVADNLEEYSQSFCFDWLMNSPNAKKIVKKRGVYNQTHFIEYLNTFVFPDEQSYLIKDLGWIDFESPMPKEYKNVPFFNF